MSSETGGAPAVPLLTLRTGAQLGRYTLVGLLGQGGMAAVYRAILQDMLAQGWGPPRHRVRISKPRLLWIVARCSLLG